MPATSFPACTAPSTAAWDPRRHLIVAVLADVCSNSRSPFPPQTWTWNGRTWQRHQDLPLESLPVLAWDPETGAVAMFAAVQNGSSAGHAALWTWTGSQWSLLSTSVQPYPGGAVAVWDRFYGMLLYGTLGGDGESKPQLLQFTQLTLDEKVMQLADEQGLSNRPGRVLSAVTDSDGHALFLGQEPREVGRAADPSDSSQGYIVLLYGDGSWHRIPWVAPSGIP
jgi:hypothetical protein